MQLILSNATVVLPDQLLRGCVVVQDGRIAEVQSGRSAGAGALDLEGDILIPGAVDLHTDNLERQVQPRMNARWPSRAALLAHDAQCAAAGVTTVFDALCVGDLGFDEDRGRTCADGIADLEALVPSGLLKCDHFLHLRCELPAEGMPAQMQAWAGHKLLRMVSLMDHTPGSGQYGDLDRYRLMRERGGEDKASIQHRIDELRAQRARLRGPNRLALLALLRTTAGADVAKPILASHDDRTAADIAENLADGIKVSEFPVNLAAARAARAGGMAVIAGAPNLVRGSSHSGNVAVAELLAAGLVDALASDYVPVSLVHAAFAAAETLGLALPAAIALISAAPAHVAGFDDRGRIAAGQRADLVRVRVHHGLPVIRQVWCAGTRVA
jgi:alpha-D-ribose 1-methylphosphonate 5-triphosphate diphosphatase